MKRSNFWLKINAFLPPLIWAGLIFFLSDQSTLPGPSYPLLDYIFKQGAHVFVYAVLHFLIFRSLSLATNLNIKNRSTISITISIIYAFMDEFHQSFIPGREAALVDIAFDSMGIMISHYLTHRQKRLHSDTLTNQ